MPPAKISLRLAVLALPVLAFYAILLSTALNIPQADDYHALLNFTNVFETLPTIHARTLFFLTALHGEYRLFFEHALILLQFHLLHHVNFSALATLGNCSLLLLGTILWQLFLPAVPLARRLTLFLPAILLLFQLHYADDCNYAMEALQNLPIVPFMLAIVYFLHRPGRAPFAAALAFLILAVATSGNGLFMIFLGTVILASNRRFAEVLSWLSLSAVLLVIYFYRYPFGQLLHKQVPVHHSLIQQWLIRKPVFFLAFIGSAASHPFKPAAVLFGLVLCAFFVWLQKQGFLRINPAVSWAILTVFTTAAGVTYTRAELGVFGSVASRYGIYSDLLLIFAWFALAEIFLKLEDLPLTRSRLYLVALTAATLFCISMDMFGFHYLRQRDAEAIAGMNRYKHTGGQQGPVQLPPEYAGAVEDSINLEARQVLARSTALGIYHPPQ